MTETERDLGPPVAIGGVGGSGTRVIAEVARRLGIAVGDCLNDALDNLWFTLLLKRPAWFVQFPTDREIVDAALLFRKAMTEGLAGNVTPAETRFLQDLGRQHSASRVSTGASEEVATNILRSTLPEANAPKRWGWKEPNSHIFLPQLAQAMPGLKYVHIVRNGIDMAHSGNQQQVRNWGRALFGLDGGTGPCASLKYWCHSHRRVLQIGEGMGPGFLFLSFDELCHDPESQLGRLCDFLGVGADEATIGGLLHHVEPPASIGRFRQYDLSEFDEDDVAYVASLGFDVA